MLPSSPGVIAAQTLAGRHLDRHPRPGPAAEHHRRRRPDDPAGAGRRLRAGVRPRRPVVPGGPARAGLAGRHHRGHPAHRAFADLHLPSRRRRQRRLARRRPADLEPGQRPGQGLVVPAGGPGPGLGRASEATDDEVARVPGRRQRARGAPDRQRRDERHDRPDAAAAARRHQGRRRRQAVPHRHPVPRLHRRDRRHLPGVLPRYRHPADQRRDRHPAGPGRWRDQEDQGLARRRPSRGCTTR